MNPPHQFQPFRDFTGSVEKALFDFEQALRQRDLVGDFTDLRERGESLIEEASGLTDSLFVPPLSESLQQLAALLTENDSQRTH